MIQKAPDAGFRVDTGPVQFGDDWPGFFMRGDSAFGTAHMLEGIAARLDNASHAKYLRGLAAKFRTCVVKNERKLRVMRNAHQHERNARILIMRINGNTLAECASRFGISRERVRQIVAKEQRRIRRHIATAFKDRGAPAAAPRKAPTMAALRRTVEMLEAEHIPVTEWVCTYEGWFASAWGFLVGPCRSPDICLVTLKERRHAQGR